MGRNVVEATKAWRILRTRGDIGRRRRRAVARPDLELFFEALADFELEAFLEESGVFGAEDWSAACEGAAIASSVDHGAEIALNSPLARASIRAYLRQN
jgi:hypothetical protein